MIKLNRPKEALTAISQVIAVSPEDASAWYYQGVALYLAGRFDESLIAYDQALAINPNTPRAWNKKGLSLQKLGQIPSVLYYRRKYTVSICLITPKIGTRGYARVLNITPGASRRG